jgi:DNA-binding CsgD family transcriptional regulator
MLVAVENGRCSGKPVAEDAEHDLVELIYAAAVDPQLWPSAMAALADRVGGSISIITRLDTADPGSSEVILSQSDPRELDRYLTHYQTKNVFAPATRPDAFARGFREKVMTDRDCLPWEDYQASEFCNDFMRPQGVNSSLFIRLELTETVNSTLSIGRSVHAERFQQREIDVARRVQPHLARAYTLVRRLSGALAHGGNLAHALDSSAHALLVVDALGAVRMMNRPAEQLLRANRGLAVLGGRLVGQHPEPAKRLQKLLTEATAADGPRLGGAMSLAMPGHRFPLAVRIAPVPMQRLPVFGEPRTALVCVTDLETGVRSPEQELCALFGLTPAEARVATAIFDGMSMREAAETLQVAHNTVRVQLARVYEKTGVTRQAELVKMMMRLAEGRGGP